MSNFVRVRGVFNDYPVEVNADILDADFDDPDFIAGTIAKVNEWGIMPPPVVASVPATPAAARAQASGYGPKPDALVPPPAQAVAQAGGCPIHGMQHVKPGYRGQGYQCGAFSSTQTEWTKDRVFVAQDGQQRWYCKSRW